MAETVLSNLPRTAYDIVIVGGGMVGASLGVALKKSGKSILVIEPLAVESKNQPSYDERTIALTYSARQIYSDIGIWDQIQKQEAEPILDIHISNRGHFGQIHLSHSHAGTEALGYVVPTRVLGKILWKHLLKSPSTDVICPASVTNINQDQENCKIELEWKKNRHTVTSRLVVICDGGRSPLSKKTGLTGTSKQYLQSAILSIVTIDRKHHGRAYERFTDEGPLALLPLSNYRSDSTRHCARYAVVWTTLNTNLEKRMSFSDSEFIEQLQQTFGDRAGNFSYPSMRKSYPLKVSSTSSPANGRILAIGNAAHTVHPVAGQGFNLGLRDVASLASLITESNQATLGDRKMIQRYIASRKQETLRVERFTHSLVTLFSNENHALSIFRNLGLNAIEYWPVAKRFLLRRTMGLHSKRRCTENRNSENRNSKNKGHTHDSSV